MRTSLGHAAFAIIKSAYLETFVRRKSVQMIAHLSMQRSDPHAPASSDPGLQVVGFDPTSFEFGVGSMSCSYATDEAMSGRVSRMGPRR